MHKYLNCYSVPNTANEPDLSKVGLHCVVHECTACEQSTDAGRLHSGLLLMGDAGDWRLEEKNSQGSFCTSLLTWVDFYSPLLQLLSLAWQATASVAPEL